MATRASEQFPTSRDPVAVLRAPCARALLGLALTGVLLLPTTGNAQQEEIQPTTIAASPPSAPQPTESAVDWSLQLPATDPVAFKGVMERDKAGIAGAAIGYPLGPGGSGAAVFLTAILVHGATNEAMKASQKAELQKAADKVLAPYEQLLSGYRHQDLIAMIGKTRSLRFRPRTGGMWTASLFSR